MNYLELHKAQYDLSKILTDTFADSLNKIHPEALICYHSQYEKFTLSIFSIVDEKTEIIYSNEFLDLMSNMKISDDVKQFAHEINDFITKELTCFATKNYMDKTQMDTEEHY